MSCPPRPDGPRTIGRKRLERERRETRSRFARALPHTPADCPRFLSEPGSEIASKCPFVSCRHHLWGHSTPSGGIMVYHPGTEPCDLPETCVVDAVAGERQWANEDIGEVIGLSVSSVRAIVDRGARAISDALAEIYPELEQDRLAGRLVGGLRSTGRLQAHQLRAERPSVAEEEVDDPDFAPPPAEEPGRVKIVMAGPLRSVELSDEQIRLRAQCPGSAMRLFDLLVLHPEAQTLGAIVRMVEMETGKRTTYVRVKGGLEQLQRAGLVEIEWRDRSVRSLGSISILT